MKKISAYLGLAAAACSLVAAAPAVAQDVKIGFAADLTGGIAAFAPGMVDAGNLAIANINAQGGVLGGQNLASVVADTTCTADGAAPAADRLVNTDNVVAMFGPYCTGATVAAATTAAIPGNVVLISPSASAPTLTTLDDNDLVYRVLVSDAAQGSKAAELLLSQGINNVGVTYVNNDYGKGLADRFVEAFEAGGGTIAANVAHEDGKADYRPEIGQIESAGTQTLVIFGYLSAGGGAILDQALETGSFTLFVGGDGMAGTALIEGRDPAALEGMITTQAAAAPGGPAYDAYQAAATAAGLDPTAVYGPQSYDAVFALALAIERNGSADREGVAAALREIATAPGEIIYPGEWEKAKGLIAAGTDIDYQGASGNLEFDEAGDVGGAIDYFVVEGGQVVNKGNIP